MSGLALVWSAWGAAAVGGVVVQAVGALVLLVVREPAQRARLVALTAGACLALPVLGAWPSLPRWSLAAVATHWLARPDSALPSGAAPAGPTLDPVVAPAPAPALVDRPEPTAQSARAAAIARHLREFPPVAPAPIAPIEWRRGVIGVWGLGVVGLVGWWGLGVIALARTVRAARPAPPPLVSRFHALVGPAGAATRLLVADRVALPVTWTTRQPVILLPRALADAAGADQDCALLHEWGHVERRDFARWTFVSLAVTLWWFCPLGWILRRDLRLSQDLLADDRAARAGSALDLAALLVRLARSRRALAGALPLPLPALGIHAQRSHLSRRVAMLVSDRPPLLLRCRPVWTGAAVGLMALLATLAAGLRLDAAPQGSPPRPPAAAAPMPASHEWTGTILDSATGKPVAGAHVRVNLANSRDPQTGRFRPIRDIEAVTPADGSYRFTLSDAEQTERFLYVTLFVRHPDYLSYYGGYSFAMILKNVGLGERPFFERLKIDPGVAVNGQILQPNGAPAAGIKVNAYSSPVAEGMGVREGRFADTRTDATGHFRLPIHPAGQAVLWLLPVDREPVTVPLPANKRGDLGVFTLKAGMRIRGRVIDEAGQPVGGVYVSAGRMSLPNDKDSGIPQGVGDNIQRTVVTEADGTFTMTPLPPGLMRVALSDNGFDPATRDDAVDLPDRPLSACFAAQKVTLTEGVDPEPLVFRALPSVVVRAQVFDSKGAKRGSFDTWLSGNIGGEWWSNKYEPTRDGTYTMRAPKGLEHAGFRVNSNEHSAMAWRYNRDAPLSRDPQVRLGTLDHDVSGIEIIRFEAPVIVARVVDPAGKPVAQPQLTVNYVEGRKPGHDGQVILGPNHYSDVSLEGPQEDGRIRTTQLQPDREVEVTAEAPGFAATSRKLTLPEGKTEELTLTLQPK